LDTRNPSLMAGDFFDLCQPEIWKFTSSEGDKAAPFRPK
jgi:hypothetical protein